MTKITLLGLLCTGLLFLNLCLSVMMFRQSAQPVLQMPHEDHKKGEQIIITKLGLSEDQANFYRELRATHMETNESLNEELFQAYNQLYDILQMPEINDQRKKTIFERIASLTTSLNSSNFEHFRALKSNLHPGQVSKFNVLTRDMRRRFVPNTGQRPHR